MRFITITLLMFIAIVSIAGESDIVITTTENTVYLCSGEESTLTVFANDPTGEITDWKPLITFSAAAYKPTTSLGTSCLRIITLAFLYRFIPNVEPKTAAPSFN